MALDVDTQRELRRPAELIHLVWAILDADPNDETNWLEWKSGLDLTSAAGRFGVAKAILGMANRMPAHARANCDGVGYIVIGAEPGNLAGVMAVDPAQLDDGLSPYLGGEKGPVWGATYADVDGSAVLVITVRRPEVGDPIYTLRKTYDNFPAGTVFVRKNGKTAPADDHDMDLLQTRLRSSSSSPLELDVSVAGDVPLSWFDPSAVKPAIRDWAESRRSDLVAEAERTEHLRSAKSLDADDPSLGAHRLAASLEQPSRLSNPLVRQDERSLEDYAAEVEKWAELVADSAEETWRARYTKHGHGVVRLRVTNPTDKNLHDVLIKARFPGGEVIGFDEFPYVECLPSPPRKYGEPQRLDVGMIPHLPAGLRDIPVSGMTPPLRSTWVLDGPVRIGWAVGDLRPRETDESDDVYLLVLGRPDDGILRGTWEATSKSTDGVLEGEIQVPVAEQPVDVVSVLKKPIGED